MTKKKKENYLDYIPKRNALYEWDVNDKGNVEIKVHNKGLFNRIAQLIWKKPKVSRIELEELGSFIWQEIDGTISIYELGKRISGKFGKKAEPLYERLAAYMKTLHENGFIVYVNKMKKKV